MNARQIAIAAAAAVALLWLHGQQTAAPVCPGPDCPNPTPVNPAPCPGPGPCPAPKPKPDSKPRKPWGAEAGSPVGELASAAACKCCPQCKCDLGKCPCRVITGGRCSRCCECGAAESKAGATVGGKLAPDGKTEINCDLPGNLHMKNTGGMGPRGPGSGAGLCVFTSIEHSSHWQNVDALKGFQQWMTHKPGGGHPQKVDQMIEAFCKERGLAKPDYLQVEGKDLEILKLACKTGRMPAVTYGVSPSGRYSGKTIAHMVSLPHADDQFFCVLDNNYIEPREGAYEWMTPQEFLKAYTSGGGGWAVILLDPGPPPVPRNR